MYTKNGLSILIIVRFFLGFLVYGKIIPLYSLTSTSDIVTIYLLFVFLFFFNSLEKNYIKKMTITDIKSLTNK